MSPELPSPILRVVEADALAGLPLVKRFDFDRSPERDRAILRPYLQAWTWRTVGPVGTLRNVSISFRPQGDAPAGGTPALQAAALAADARWTIFQSAGIRIATYAPTDGRGIPFPIDDSGPWILWIGSSADLDLATFRAQIGWIPICLTPRGGGGA